MTTLKPGALVTVDFEDKEAANTYIIARKLEHESLLQHPLYPDIFLLKKDEELNKVGAVLKNNEERQIEYSLKYKKYLDYNDLCVLDALTMYFVVNRRLSDSQKKMLSDICGQIANVYCNGDLNRAIDLVNANRALLNAFNENWYQNFKKFFLHKKPVESPGQRKTIFNMAGFILAQLL